MVRIDHYLILNDIFFWSQVLIWNICLRQEMICPRNIFLSTIQLSSIFSFHPGNISICSNGRISFFLIESIICQFCLIGNSVPNATDAIGCTCMWSFLPYICNIALVRSCYSFYINIIIEPPKVIISLNIDSDCVYFQLSNHLHSRRNVIFKNKILILLKNCFFRIDYYCPSINIRWLVIRYSLWHRPIRWLIPFYSSRLISWSSINTHTNSILKPGFFGRCCIIKVIWAYGSNALDCYILWKIRKCDGFFLIIHKIIYFVLKKNTIVLLHRNIAYVNSQVFISVPLCVSSRVVFRRFFRYNHII